MICSGTSQLKSFYVLMTVNKHIITLFLFNANAVNHVSNMKQSENLPNGFVLKSVPQ